MSAVNPIFMASPLHKGLEKSLSLKGKRSAAGGLVCFVGRVGVRVPGSKHLEQHWACRRSSTLTRPAQEQPHTDVCWNRSATQLLVLARATSSPRHLPSPGTCYSKVVGMASQRNQWDAGKEGRAT